MSENARHEAAPEIPDRLFFRIGDVSKLTGVEPYVLRFWEGEFPMLSPKKTSSGQRQYRRKDVQTVLEIKRLLYDEGYTIAGARRVLRQRARQKKQTPKPQSQPALPFSSNPGQHAAHLATIKKELREILTLLRPS